jgi:hypothetical protein
MTLSPQLNILPKVFILQVSPRVLDWTSFGKKDG